MHQASPQEVQALLAIADRDLADARVKGLSADWQFSIAYNAALQAAVAALAAAGFRAAREAHHFRVIQSLTHTIGADPMTVRRLDAFRKKRNTAEYEHTGTVSEQEITEMLTLAGKLCKDVRNWIGSHRRDLL